MNKWSVFLFLPLLGWGVLWSKTNHLLPPLEVMPGIRVAGYLLSYEREIPQIQQLKLSSQLRNGHWEILLQLELEERLSAYAYLLDEEGKYLSSWPLVQGVGSQQWEWSCPANARQEQGYFLLLSDEGYWLEEVSLVGRE